MKLHLKTRALLTLVVLLSASPLLAMMIYGTVEQRVMAAQRNRDELQRVASAAAQNESRIVEGARQTLIAIAQLAPSLKNDPTGCDAFFADLLRNIGDVYHAIGVHNMDGDVVCDAVPRQKTVNVLDRLYFRVARDTRQFAIGEYQIGRVTQRPGVNFGYPITVGTELVGVAFVALDLHSVYRSAVTMRLPAGAVFTVVDGNGTIVAASPQTHAKIGTTLSTAIIRDTVLSQYRGMFEATGTDNVRRWFAFDTVAVNADGSNAVKAIVSMPRTLVFAESNRTLLRNVLGIALSVLFCLFVARYGVERFFLRKIRKLLATASSVKAGDLTARTGLRPTEDELSDIGAAFDEMADALQDRDARISRSLDDLQCAAVTDVLTGLHNRRHLDEYLPRELARAARSGNALALLLMDLDHFKRVNDTYGHSAGDAALRAVASVLKSNIRPGDAVFRHGGEEFVVVLPNTRADAALVRADALRKAIRNVKVAHAECDLRGLTASCGLAVFPIHGERQEELMRAADKALYIAKARGRDQVVLAE